MGAHSARAMTTMDVIVESASERATRATPHSGKSATEAPGAVSYTHLTLPTILLV